MSDLIPVEYRTERVLTTEQLAQAYECEPNNIKKNFNSNKEHFEEGRHYYKVEGDALNDLRVTFSDLQISPKTRCLYLWTRRGASRHSKMLGTDRAWEMFDALEESYFNPRPKALTPAEQMAQVGAKGSADIPLVEFGRKLTKFHLVVLVGVSEVEQRYAKLVHHTCHQSVIGTEHSTYTTQIRFAEIDAHSIACTASDGVGQQRLGRECGSSSYGKRYGGYT